MTTDRYRHRAIEITALQWNPGSLVDVARVVGPLLGEGVDFRHPSGEGATTTLLIDTPEGEQLAQPGDWIIRVDGGDWAVMGADDFAERYEPAVPPGCWYNAEAAEKAMWTESTPAAVSVPPPADRPALLLWAADRLGRMDYDTDNTDYGYDTYRDAWNGGVMDAAALLRRVAAEEQPAETQAHAAEHTWAAELYDPLADEWVPGTRYLVRERAVKHLAHARSVGPTWKDGTPTQRRLVRATTTYTVEAEHTPPAARPAVGEQPETQEADRA